MTGEKMFNNEEMNLVKSIFGKNEKLLKTVRKFLFQGEMTNDEKKLLGMLKTMGGVKLVKKFLMPEIDPESPLFQFADLFIGVATKDRSAEMVELEITSRELMVKYLAKQFEILENDFEIENPIKIKDLLNFNGKDAKQKHIELGARNALLSHIDFQMQQIKLISEQKEETPEEKEKREKKDSVK